MIMMQLRFLPEEEEAIDTKQCSVDPLICPVLDRGHGYLGIGYRRDGVFANFFVIPSDSLSTSNQVRK